jgi:hypothetical protein
MGIDKTRAAMMGRTGCTADEADGLIAIAREIVGVRRTGIARSFTADDLSNPPTLSAARALRLAKKYAGPLGRAMGLAISYEGGFYAANGAGAWAHGRPNMRGTAGYSSARINVGRRAS